MSLISPFLSPVTGIVVTREGGRHNESCGAASRVCPSRGLFSIPFQFLLPLIENAKNFSGRRILSSRLARDTDLP